MHKEHPGTKSRCPLKGLHACIYRKGDFCSFAAVIVNLKAIEGIVDPRKAFYFQETPKK
jgi:hypothetical protein